MTNYYVSDLHMYHENALKFDNAPFPDIESRDKTIIGNWNNAVNLDDDVYILGDVSFANVTKTIEVLKKLNGNLHLIVGNHDRKFLKNRDFRNCFVEICDYKEITDDISPISGIVLCHYPIICYNNRHRGWACLHGHIHSNEYENRIIQEAKEKMARDCPDMPCNIYNVGIMMPYMGYTPRTLTEIIDACGWREKKPRKEN